MGHLMLPLQQRCRGVATGTAPGGAYAWQQHPASLLAACTAGGWQQGLEAFVGKRPHASGPEIGAPTALARFAVSALAGRPGVHILCAMCATTNRAPRPRGGDPSTLLCLRPTGAGLLTLQVLLADVVLADNGLEGRLLGLNGTHRSVHIVLQGRAAGACRVGRCVGGELRRPHRWVQSKVQMAEPHQ